MKITIPKQFNILGHTIKVKMGNPIVNGRIVAGSVDPNNNIIELATTIDGNPIGQSMLEHTYLHEITHLILDTMGENELYYNEKFVDLFAGLLHQVLITSK